MVKRERITRWTHRSAGFTLIERLVVMAMLAIVVLIGLPALQQLILRNKVEGFARQTRVNLQVARQEAIRRRVPVVVRFDDTTQEIFAFADVAPPGGRPDFEFDPVAGTPEGRTDYEVGRWPLPTAASRVASVRFATPGAGMETVVGFTTIDDEQLLVFQPSGAVRNTGAFRFGDFRDPGSFAAGTCGNCFEIRVEPAATARVELLKYHHEDGEFYPQGRRGNKALWKWY